MPPLPQHGVSDAELEAWVRARGLSEVPAHREDLCLAIACARGDSAALTAFDARYAPLIAQTAKRFGDEDFAAEVGQLVRRRLLLADGANPPRIAEYLGKGELAKFAQAVAARTALNLLDANARHAHVHGDDSLLEVPAGTDNPEFAAIKLRYRDAFKQAFAAAMASLDPQLRTALRLHYLDGLTLGDLGGLYGWSVPTASRRLAAARESLLEQTRSLMTERLKLTPAELDSVLRLIESRLSVDALQPR
jgi:RNA polymerase sigma-70 factor (ECF subfamily)